MLPLIPDIVNWYLLFQISLARSLSSLLTLKSSFWFYWFPFFVLYFIDFCFDLYYFLLFTLDLICFVFVFLLPFIGILAGSRNKCMGSLSVYLEIRDVTWGTEEVNFILVLLSGSSICIYKTAICKFSSARNLQVLFKKCWFCCLTDLGLTSQDFPLLSYMIL